MSASFARAVVIASFGVFATGTVLAIAFDVDAGDSDQLANDLVFRSARAPVAVRHVDPSPSLIWTPSDLFVRAHVLHLEIPEWDRGQGGGFSVFSQMQPGPLFLPRWLLAPIPARQTQAALWLLSLAALFAGSTLFARRVGASPGAALAGAAFVTTSSSVLSLVPFDNFASAVVPWLALAACEALDGRARGIALTAVTTLLLLTSGHPFCIGNAALAAAVLVLAFGPPLSRRGVAASSMGLVAGALIAAPAWVPFVIALPDMWSYKTASALGVAYHAMSWSHWLDVVGHGLLWPSERAPVAEAFKNTATVGPIVTALGVAGAVALWRRRRRAPALFALGFFLVAFPPPPLEILGSVPGLRLDHPWYLQASAIAVLAVVVAFGVDTLVDAIARRFPGRARAHVVVAIVATAAVSVPSAVRMAPFLPLHSRLSSETALGFVPDSPALRVLESAGENERITGGPGQTLPANTAEIFGLEDARLQGPLLPFRLLLFWAVMDPQMSSYTFPTAPTTRNVDHPLLALSGVRFTIESKKPGVLFTSDEANDSTSALPPPLETVGLDLAYEDSWVRIWRRANPAPRVRISAAPISLAGIDDVLAQWRKSPADVGVVDLVEAPTSLGHLPQPGDDVARAATLSVRYPRDTAVDIDVNVAAPALVVLADAYAPGWTATVDGNEAPILPVDLAFRGVVVGEGAHAIHMRYATPGLAQAALVSALALLLLIVVVRRAARNGALAVRA